MSEYLWYYTVRVSGEKNAFLAVPGWFLPYSCLALLRGRR